jgi:hypothetical protein
MRTSQLISIGISHTPPPRRTCFDLLGCHDNRIHYQPNSIRDEYDGQAQMAALTIMRPIPHHFTSHELRHGPFNFTLTDMHQSNVCVDGIWHVRRLIDLEWACSLPIEMLHPPTWLTSRGVDQLEEGENLEAYSRMHAEFTDAFEEQEKRLPPANGDALYDTRTMRRGWKIGIYGISRLWITREGCITSSSSTFSQFSKIRFAQARYSIKSLRHIDTPVQLKSRLRNSRTKKTTMISCEKT